MTGPDVTVGGLPHDLQAAADTLGGLARILGPHLPSAVPGTTVTLAGPQGPTAVDVESVWAEHTDAWQATNVVRMRVRLAGQNTAIVVSVTEDDRYYTCHVNGELVRDRLDWLGQALVAALDYGEEAGDLVDLAEAALELRALADAVRLLDTPSSLRTTLTHLGGCGPVAATAATLAGDWDGDLAGLAEAAEALAAQSEPTP